jgi:hypothetical protein
MRQTTQANPIANNRSAGVVTHGASSGIGGAVRGAPSGCLEEARGDVAVHSFGPAEVMTVGVENLPPNTKFDLCLLQLPGRGGGPFGIASYEGDIETNAQGDGKGVFIGRFNRETFTMAPDRAARRRSFTVTVLTMMPRAIQTSPPSTRTTSGCSSTRRGPPGGVVAPIR